MDVRESAIGSEGKRGVYHGARYCLSVWMFCGVVLARKFDAYEPVARLIALKYPSLESLGRWIVWSEGCFFMERVALWYSLRSFVRRVVHHGLDLRQGRERRVLFIKRAVREFSEEENDSLSWAGTDVRGPEGCRKIQGWVVRCPG